MEQLSRKEPNVWLSKQMSECAMEALWAYRSPSLLGMSDKEVDERVQRVKVEYNLPDGYPMHIIRRLCCEPSPPRSMKILGATEALFHSGPGMSNKEALDWERDGKAVASKDGRRYGKTWSDYVSGRKVFSLRHIVKIGEILERIEMEIDLARWGQSPRARFWFRYAVDIRQMAEFELSTESTNRKERERLRGRERRTREKALRGQIGDTPA